MDFLPKLKSLFSKYNTHILLETTSDTLFLLVVNEITINDLSFSVFDKNSTDIELFRMNVHCLSNTVDICSNSYGHGFNWLTVKYLYVADLLNLIENELIQLQ